MPLKLSKRKWPKLLSLFQWKTFHCLGWKLVKLVSGGHSLSCIPCWGFLKLREKNLAKVVKSSFSRLLQSVVKSKNIFLADIDCFQIIADWIQVNRRKRNRHLSKLLDLELKTFQIQNSSTKSQRPFTSHQTLKSVSPILKNIFHSMEMTIPEHYWEIVSIHHWKPCLLQFEVQRLFNCVSSFIYFK